MTTVQCYVNCSELAKGYYECDITDDDTVLMNESWEHKGENSVDVVKFQIRHFPSVGIRDSQGQLVAWEMTYFIGCMGMLHVLPEHRGKGLAQYVIYKLGKKLLAQGRKVYSFVADDNTASKKLHEKCGFYEEPGTESVFAIMQNKKS